VVVCLCVPATSWSGSIHFATACAVVLHLYSSCAWFVGVRPNQIAAGCRWRATQPFLRTICVENPFCDLHVRARKDEGEDVLREGILSSSSQFWRAVCEKLFSEKLFSEPGCLREAVLEKPFSDWPFYESQLTSCSGRSCSTKSGSVRSGSCVCSDPSLLCVKCAFCARSRQCVKGRRRRMRQRHLRGWHQHISCVRAVVMFEPRQYVTSTCQVGIIRLSSSNQKPDADCCGPDPYSDNNCSNIVYHSLLHISLHTYREPRPHGQGCQLRTNDHN